MVDWRRMDMTTWFTGAVSTVKMEKILFLRQLRSTSVEWVSKKSIIINPILRTCTFKGGVHQFSSRVMEIRLE